MYAPSQYWEHNVAEFLGTVQNLLIPCKQLAAGWLWGLQCPKTRAPTVLHRWPISVMGLQSEEQ